LSKITNNFDANKPTYSVQKNRHFYVQLDTGTKTRFKSRKPPEFTSENLLKQEFNPKAPNQVWTTDFTYISIGYKRHVYLCAILDLYSRKCIAWKLSHKMDANLTHSFSF